MALLVFKGTVRMSQSLKLLLPVGSIHFANIYKPLIAEGATRPMYGFSIDREFLEDDERFNEMFTKTPGARGKNAIPATCKRQPEVQTNDVDGLIDRFLICQATNVTGDKILLENEVEIEIEFFDLTTVGRLGQGLSLKSVKVLLK